METILKTNNGELIQGNNIEVLNALQENSIDNCISDFPYDLVFMGKKWDNTGNFYQWCYDRAIALHRVIKSGGYVLIFGHPKTNHRMKSAFEDAGFKIVDEIDWIYSSGFPKNQDIGKLFDKNNSKDLAKQWDGWKTAGLKPAHEPITIFQKPLDGTYINNIEKYGVGAMNIDACRVPYKNDKDLEIVKAKCGFTENSKSIGFGNEESLYGTGNTPLEQARDCVKENGRFPANIIFDNNMGDVLDEQSGITKSGKVKENKLAYDCESNTGFLKGVTTTENQYGDEGGASRFFSNFTYTENEVIELNDIIPFYYCAKASTKERGEGNVHTTVKPKELIKWLIKLVTPKNGTTIDITAGSGTHGLSVEELNKNDGYNIKWIDIELNNTEKEPYCDIAKSRIEKVI